jgi:hypothetical protein
MLWAFLNEVQKHSGTLWLTMASAKMTEFNVHKPGRHLHRLNGYLHLDFKPEI